MSEWLANAIARAEQVEDWLYSKRQVSLELLRGATWPTRKVEAWRYTPVRALEKLVLDNTAANDSVSIPSLGMPCLDVVFIDGQFSEELSAKDWPQGVHVVSLAAVDEATQATALARFNSVKPERHVFGLVNDVLARDGALISIDQGVTIETPIRIVNWSSAGVESHTRILCALGANSHAEIIEHNVGSGSGFSTVFCEYQVGESAALRHSRLALQTGAALNIGGCHFDLLAQAQLNSTLIALGSELSRLDLDVKHSGSNAHAQINALYVLAEKQLFDLHSTIEHAVANGTTTENVRGVVADQAKVVFNGRIHIHKDAQKTLAELNNRNLLLSDKAEVNTKPELEIYADDVRCAHGATVAKMEEKALYYLQSRGISRIQAQIMLNIGFVNELLEEIPNADLANWARTYLEPHFAKLSR